MEQTACCTLRRPPAPPTAAPFSTVLVSCKQGDWRPYHVGPQAGHAALPHYALDPDQVVVPGANLPVRRQKIGGGRCAPLL